MNTRSRDHRSAQSWPALAGGPLALLLLLGALAALAAGCGLKKPPQPMSAIVPPPSGLLLRQFGDDVLVSWLAVPPERADPFGGLREIRLWIEELPPGCLSCPSLQTRELAFKPGDEELVEEGRRIHYRFHPERRESGWRPRAAYRFGDGASRTASAAAIPGLSPVPQPVLRWEWAARPAEAKTEGLPEARLAWEAPQEGIVRVMAPGVPPSEQVLLYRANLYRRAPKARWPFIPVNSVPVRATFWSEKPPPAQVERGGGTLEYALRLVDRSGGEGPLSEPVRIPFSPAGTR